MVESESRAPTSGALRHLTGYNLNHLDLADLKSHEAIDELSWTALSVLDGKRYQSRRDFLDEVRKVLGDGTSAEKETVVAAHAKRLSARKLARYAKRRMQTTFATSAIAPSLGAAMMLRPFTFSLWFHMRAFGLRMRSALHSTPVVRSAINANAAGFEHNLRQIMDFLPGHRNRTERLVNVLRCIQGVDPQRARLLCVGPRNEAEVLLLELYGFRRRSIEAIDLFSYSPRIRLLDMNELDYPDDAFDIYYSSAVIKYSPDIRRTISEAIRVTRNGGVMAFGFTYGTPGELAPSGSNLFGGSKELLELFDGHVDWIYWNEEFDFAPGDIRTTVIFRLRK